MINTFNKNIAINAVLSESARHFDNFNDHDGVETMDGIIGVDDHFNLYAYPAKGTGGYSKIGIPVICGKQTEKGCAAYHGTVSFIRKLGATA